MEELRLTLRAARVNCGLTLKEVAERVGKSAETIAKYEADSTQIPRDLMIDLIKLYDIQDRYIFFGVESSFHGLKRKKVFA